MSEQPQGPEEFCLWDSWYEIEEELAEVSPTVRVQYDAMRRKVIEQYYGPGQPGEAGAQVVRKEPQRETGVKKQVSSNAIEVKPTAGKEGLMKGAGDGPVYKDATKVLK